MGNCSTFAKSNIDGSYDDFREHIPLPQTLDKSIVNFIKS